jgi:hypothetical protein
LLVLFRKGTFVNQFSELDGLIPQREKFWSLLVIAAGTAAEGTAEATGAEAVTEESQTGCFGTNTAGLPGSMGRFGRWLSPSHRRRENRLRFYFGDFRDAVTEEEGLK